MGSSCRGIFICLFGTQGIHISIYNSLANTLFKVEEDHCMSQVICKRSMDDAIDRAKRGDLKFLKEAPVDILLNARDSNDDTVLTMVVYNNRLDCCEVICERCPSLLYYQTHQGGSIPLHSAAYSGYLDILKLLISACNKADQEADRAGKQKTLTLRTTNYGDNAMHKATHGSQPESVKLLIEADPNKELLRAGDRKNNTPLHLAVGLKSDPVIARLLIKADPDFPYGLNSDRKTPLLIAIDKAAGWQNDREMLKLIMELQPTQSMVHVNENGWTALHYCVSRKYLDTIEYIIQSCPESSEVSDSEGQNFFHHAVKLGNVEMVKHILGMKEITSTVLNSPDNLGRTPLDVAAVSRNERMILCLHEDPRVNKKLTVTKNLNWIVEKHNFVMMNMFMETNADFLMNIDLEVIQNSVDVNGDTILFKAGQENHLLLCKELYKRCPSLIYHQSKDGRTALHNAAWRGEPEMLKFLITAGAKSYNEYAEGDNESGGNEKIPQKMLLTMVDEQGDTALHKAALNHKLEAVKLLVEADPNKELLRAGDLKNNTALHLAVGLKSDHEIARFLIEADPNFHYGANSDRKTPLLIAIDKAERQNDREMLELILELQPNQSKVKVHENGWTALHYSVSSGFLHTIGCIIQSCPESSKVADNEGQNFFHHAVKSGNVEMVKHILGMKEITSTVLNSQDNLGRTPWDVAAVSRNESMILCLHEDPRMNKKLTVTKNLNWVVENHNFVIMNLLLKTNADLLMNIESEVFQNSVDEEGDTILFKAAQENHLFLCEELYERCPSLIYHRSKGGCTALHHAACKGEPKMLKFLIGAGAKSYEYAAEEDIESGGGEKIPLKMLLTMIDDQGDTALHKAVLNHKLEAVKLLVEADPDYKYRANNFGDTPIMISIREARSNDNKFDSGEIRRLLFKMQPRQTMAHSGEKGWTSLLHQATSEEDLSIIEDIIKFCTEYLDVEDDNGKNFLHIAVELGKIEVVRLVLSAKYIIKLTSCLEQLDNEGKNFLHIAAELGKIEVVRLVLRAKDIINLPSCLERLDNEGKNILHIAAEFEKVDIVKQVLRDKDISKDGVLNKKDNDGNTPFHIAALTGNEPLTRRFLFDRRVDKNTVNNDKQHVLSEINFPYDKRKAGVHRIAHTVDQSELKDQSDFDLVVGALIATVSFAAGITVPGGYISDGPNQGTAVFSKRVSFASFTISNTFALVFSLFAVFSHFCARRLSWDADIICLLNVAKFCTLTAMYCMMAAFIAGSFAILAKSNWLAIVVCIISCLFFIFGCGPLWMWMIGLQSKRPASQHILIWVKKCFGLANLGNGLVEEGGNALVSPKA